MVSYLSLSTLQYRIATEEQLSRRAIPATVVVLSIYLWVDEMLTIKHELCTESSADP